MGWEFVNSIMFQIDRGENVPSEEDKEENRFEERKDEGSDDDEGWITPSNIKQIQRELEQCTIPKDVRVGCVTTDFAMQVGGMGYRLVLRCVSYLSWALVPQRFGSVYRATV